MERASREHLAGEVSGRKNPELKPETAALKIKLDQASTGDKARIHSRDEQLRRDIAAAGVEDQMKSLVKARGPEIEALGFSITGRDENEDRVIPPPPLPQFEPRVSHGRKKPARRETANGDSVAA